MCSVTMRAHTTAQVIEVARGAGLPRIEWGADVHAPPGDQGHLAELRARTTEAGLAVASYGSYWRAGISSPSEMTTLVEAANALGAPRIRLWAGQIGTAQADDDVWDSAVRSLREACAVAREHSITLALEFHPNTLTDSVDSTLKLLERVDDPTLRTYWQPRLDEPVEPAVDGLRRLLPVLAGVHVFSWWPAATRLPLAQRSDLWASVTALLMGEIEPCDLMLEFVPDDDAALIPGEAQTLRALMTAGRTTLGE
ncbi:hypothetical protein VV02_16645 [Luteipulveratus mongoliensis]|uniref:Xylose isomerase-like TIM barrel domain-containing protein n=2 Tax=Luteipulveratus mongoliensis TaxID=571913 RepID=A0A0K1JQZ6_9MICO|nr:hypothetical protein VV02_16645 [Luteipulveratus mongoliensis]